MSAEKHRRGRQKRRPNGHGTVYPRKDGRWVARAYLLMPDGTSERRDFYAASEAAANRKLVEALARSHQGLPAEATGWTVERFLTYWLESIVEPSRKPRTHQGYEIVARVHLIPGLCRPEAAAEVVRRGCPPVLAATRTLVPLLPSWS